VETSIDTRNYCTWWRMWQCTWQCMSTNRWNTCAQYSTEPWSPTTECQYSSVLKQAWWQNSCQILKPHWSRALHKDRVGTGWHSGDRNTWVELMYIHNCVEFEQHSAEWWRLGKYVTMIGEFFELPKSGHFSETLQIAAKTVVGSHEVSISQQRNWSASESHGVTVDHS